MVNLQLLIYDGLAIWLHVGHHNAKLSVPFNDALDCLFKVRLEIFRMLIGEMTLGGIRKIAGHALEKDASRGLDQVEGSSTSA